MAIQYDDYVYRLTSSDPAYTVDLPKDLIWVNETSWDSVSQSIEWSTTGALLIQEGQKQKGREILMTGRDDMAWISRTDGLILMAMRDHLGLTFNFEFVDKTDSNNVLFAHTVKFLHSGGKALDLKNIKDFDQYESDAWYIIRSLSLIEVS